MSLEHVEGAEESEPVGVFKRLSRWLGGGR